MRQVQDVLWELTFRSSRNSRYKHATIQWHNSCKASDVSFTTTVRQCLVNRIQARITREMKPQLRNCLDEMGYWLILTAYYYSSAQDTKGGPTPERLILHCLWMLTEHGPESTMLSTTSLCLNLCADRQTDTASPVLLGVSVLSPCTGTGMKIQ